MAARSSVARGDHVGRRSLPSITRLERKRLTAGSGFRAFGVQDLVRWVPGAGLVRRVRGSLKPHAEPHPEPDPEPRTPNQAPNPAPRTKTLNPEPPKPRTRLIEKR